MLRREGLRGVRSRGPDHAEIVRAQERDSREQIGDQPRVLGEAPHKLMRTLMFDDAPNANFIETPGAAADSPVVSRGGGHLGMGLMRPASHSTHRHSGSPPGPVHRSRARETDFREGRGGAGTHRPVTFSAGTRQDRAGHGRRKLAPNRSRDTSSTVRRRFERGGMLHVFRLL